MTISLKPRSLRGAIYAVLAILALSTAQAQKAQVVYFGSFQNTGADFTILDLFEFSSNDVSKCRYPIAYASAHYEDWRPDAKSFGRKLRKIGGWRGEYYIKWDDPRNMRVMRARMDLAVRKGFRGIDWDNVDGSPHAYFGWLLSESKKRGLKVGLKNYVEILSRYGHACDFFVTEASQKSELDCYLKYRKPVIRMYYGRGAKTPYFITETRNKRNGSRF